MKNIKYYRSLDNYKEIVEDIIGKIKNKDFEYETVCEKGIFYTTSKFLGLKFIGRSRHKLTSKYWCAYNAYHFFLREYRGKSIMNINELVMYYNKYPEERIVVESLAIIPDGMCQDYKIYEVKDAKKSKPITEYLVIK